MELTSLPDGMIHDDSAKHIAVEGAGKGASGFAIGTSLDIDGIFNNTSGTFEISHRHFVSVHNHWSIF